MINIKIYNKDLETKMNGYKNMSNDQLIEYINTNIEEVHIHDNTLTAIDKIFEYTSDYIESDFEYEQYYDFIFEDETGYYSKNLHQDDLLEIIDKYMERDVTYYDLFSKVSRPYCDHIDLLCDWEDHEDVSTAITNLVQYFIDENEFETVEQIIKHCKIVNNFIL